MNKILGAATRLATISATAKLPAWLLGMSPAHQKAYLKEHPESPFAAQLNGAKVEPEMTDAQAEEKAKKFLLQALVANGDAKNSVATRAKISAFVKEYSGMKGYSLIRKLAAGDQAALLYVLNNHFTGTDFTIVKIKKPDTDSHNGIPSNYKVPKDGTQAVRINGDVGKGKQFVEKVTALGFSTQTKPLTKPILDRLMLKADTILDVKTKLKGKFVRVCFITHIDGKWYWMDTHVDGMYYMIKQGLKVDSLVEALNIELPEPKHVPTPIPVKPVGGKMATRKVPNGKAANVKLGDNAATMDKITIGNLGDAEDNILAYLANAKLFAAKGDAAEEAAEDAMDKAVAHCIRTTKGRQFVVDIANGDDDRVAEFVQTYFDPKEKTFTINGKEFPLGFNPARQKLEDQLKTLNTQKLAIMRKGRNGSLTMTQMDKMEEIDAKIDAVEKRLKMKVVSSTDLGGLAIKSSKRGLVLVFGKNESVDLGSTATINTLNLKRMSDTLSQQVHDVYDGVMDDLISDKVEDVEADDEENDTGMSDSQIQREAEKRATASSLKDPEITLMRKLMNDKAFLSEIAQAILDKASSSK